MRLVSCDLALLNFAIDGERDPVLAALFPTPAARATLLNRHAHCLLARGLVVMAAGLIEWWPGRAEGWVFSHRDARPRELVAGVRLIRDWLDVVQAGEPERYRRLEIYVRGGAAYRDSFAQALGFEFEAMLRSYDREGRDYCVYSRIAPPLALRAAA